MADNNPTPAKNNRAFSIVNAPYVVGQDATLAQVMDDLGCFLTASLDAFESMSESFNSQTPGYAALYALRQASALYDVAGRLVDSDWHPKGSA